ncbi:Ig-like domain-containing protein [Aquimarina sp. AU474]|uniref:Ig-like domain-containing protein n=1 Tax=Aquimarina sp. AU474 TaxID=2108529 RepID=UPI000D695E95|nr:Ig-like domain-containing protein [Aquimarina sp. AU474]
MKKNRNRIASVLFIVLLSILNSCGSDDALPPDTTPPANITLTLNDVAGDDNTVIRISNTIQVKANASDDVGVFKIELFIDNQKIAEDTTAPFELTADVSSFETGEHILKVTASDAAGNTASKESNIFIDNTMPSITNLSIENNTILGGDENTLTFDVTDDAGINTVAVLINSVSIAEITNEDYEVIIKTNALEDGNNEIKIVATDDTGNVSTVIQNFVADNTGPQIEVSNLVEDQIIDKILNFKPEITDIHSEVVSLEILFNDQQIKLFENISNFDFDFDPEIYNVGPGVFKFVAIDNLGNQTEKIITSKVLRALLRLEHPTNFINQYTSEFWIFASNPDGTTISAQQIERGTNQTVLYAPGEFNTSDEFMITFYSHENTVDSRTSSRISTIQNLTRVLPETITISDLDRSVGVISQEFNNIGFPESSIVRTEGKDHFGNKLSQTSSFEITQGVTLGDIYWYYYDFPDANGASYKYLKVNTPLANDFVLKFSDFGTTNVEFKTLITNSNKDVLLRIFGFETQEDFNNNEFHEIYRNYNINNFTGNPVGYPLINSFSKYRHRISFGDYTTEREGPPLATYERPNWTIDYNLVNNNLNLTKSGDGHTLGRAWLRNSNTIPTEYSWTLVYDSQKTSEVILPDLPEELAHLNFYNFLKSNTLEVSQVELTAYQGILSYEEYVNQIIRYKKNYYQESDYVDSIYKTSLGQFLLTDFFF